MTFSTNTVATRAQYPSRSRRTATLPKAACSDPISNPSPNRTTDTHKAAKPSFRAYSTLTTPTRKEAQGESKGASREDRPLSETATILPDSRTAIANAVPRKSPKTPVLAALLAGLDRDTAAPVSWTTVSKKTSRICYALVADPSICLKQGQTPQDPVSVTLLEDDLPHFQPYSERTRCPCIDRINNAETTDRQTCPTTATAGRSRAVVANLYHHQAPADRTGPGP